MIMFNLNFTFYYITGARVPGMNEVTGKMCFVYVVCWSWSLYGARGPNPERL